MKLSLLLLTSTFVLAKFGKEVVETFFKEAGGRVGKLPSQIVEHVSFRAEAWKKNATEENLRIFDALEAAKTATIDMNRFLKPFIGEFDVELINLKNAKKFARRLNALEMRFDSFGKLFTEDIAKVSDKIDPSTLKKMTDLKAVLDDYQTSFKELKNLLLEASKDKNITENVEMQVKYERQITLLREKMNAKELIELQKELKSVYSKLNYSEKDVKKRVFEVLKVVGVAAFILVAAELYNYGTDMAGKQELGYNP